MTKNLEPLAPTGTEEVFLVERRGQIAEKALRADDHRLRHFTRWAVENGLDDLNDLDGRTLHKFRLRRQEDGDLEKVSLLTQLESLRVFIRWCESIEAVPEGLHEKVLLPTQSKEEGRREEILNYLRAWSTPPEPVPCWNCSCTPGSGSVRSTDWTSRTTTPRTPGST